MKLVAGALSLYLLAAPMQAQQPMPKVGEQRVVNELECMCKENEHVIIYIPDTDEIIDVTSGEKPDSTSIDYSKLHDILAKHPKKIIQYHCHTAPSARDIVMEFTDEYSDDLPTMSKQEKRDLLTEKYDQINAILTVMYDTPSENDLKDAAMKKQVMRELFPDTAYVTRLVNVTNHTVTEYDTLPLDAMLEKIAAGEDQSVENALFYLSLTTYTKYRESIYPELMKKWIDIDLFSLLNQEGVGTMRKIKER